MKYKSKKFQISLKVPLHKQTNKIMKGIIQLNQLIQINQKVMLNKLICLQNLPLEKMMEPDQKGLNNI